MIRRVINKLRFIVNEQIRKGTWFNEMLFPDCRKLINQRSFNLDIVNLGSSSAVSAFNYRHINANCANWAMRCNPLAGDVEILKNYVSYLKPQGAKVFVTLCPFSSLAGSYEVTDDRYYSVLYPSSITSFSKKKQIEINTMYKSPILYYSFYGFLRDVKNILSLKKKRGLQEDEFVIDALNWIRSWQKEFSIIDFEQPLSLVNKDAIVDAIAHLHKIIDFCREHDAEPIIVIPPVHHTLSNMITERMRSEFINCLVEEAEKKEVRCLAYLYYPEISNNTGLFKNSFLLNEKGAALFTEKLLKDIECASKIS